VNLHPVVRGCYIAETHGRFDLLIEKPTDDDLRSAEQCISAWVKGNYEIAMLSLHGEPECRICPMRTARSVERWRNSTTMQMCSALR
jgi:hypothetical protein